MADFLHVLFYRRTKRTVLACNGAKGQGLGETDICRTITTILSEEESDESTMRRDRHIYIFHWHIGRSLRITTCEGGR
jgi:hypothetical protein